EAQFGHDLVVETWSRRVVRPEVPGDHPGPEFIEVSIERQALLEPPFGVQQLGPRQIRGEVDDAGGITVAVTEPKPMTIKHRTASILRLTRLRRHRCSDSEPAAFTGRAWANNRHLIPSQDRPLVDLGKMISALL